MLPSWLWEIYFYWNMVHILSLQVTQRRHTWRISRRHIHVSWKLYICSNQVMSETKYESTRKRSCSSLNRLAIPDCRREWHSRFQRRWVWSCRWGCEASWWSGWTQERARRDDEETSSRPAATTNDYCVGAAPANCIHTYVRYCIYNTIQYNMFISDNKVHSYTTTREKQTDRNKENRHIYTVL